MSINTYIYGQNEFLLYVKYHQMLLLLLNNLVAAAPAWKA